MAAFSVSPCLCGLFQPSNQTKVARYALRRFTRFHPIPRAEWTTQTRDCGGGSGTGGHRNRAARAARTRTGAALRTSQKLLRAVVDEPIWNDGSRARRAGPGTRRNRERTDRSISESEPALVERYLGITRTDQTRAMDASAKRAVCALPGNR